MSKVFLSSIDSHAPQSLLNKCIASLWRQAGFDDVFSQNDLSAIKLHVGEPGTKTFAPPAVAAELVKLIASTGAAPFLTDSAVLYRSPRDNAIGHVRVAHDHGFNLERCGAPFIPADGLTGADEIEIPFGGVHFEKVAISSAIMHARSLLVLSHATGHLGTGFGGALKNLGMGCASRKGKLQQHHGQSPHIDSERCVACGVCAEWCPASAIVVSSAALILSDKCIGCGECIAACREGAVQFDWSIMGNELQERIVEYAAAVVRAKQGKIAYVTVAQQITKDCDCLGLNQRPVVDDIGILASLDPVAIDQAVLTLVQKKAGRTLESLSYPNLDGTWQLRCAEKLGIGTSRFELVEV